MGNKWHGGGVFAFHSHKVAGLLSGNNPHSHTLL